MELPQEIQVIVTEEFPTGEPREIYIFDTLRRQTEYTRILPAPILQNGAYPEGTCFPLPATICLN